MAAAAVVAFAAGAEPKQIDLDDDKLYRDDRNLVYDGIDVSSYQKDIDWSTTAADRNIKFVYVKATEGATFVSRHYRRNIDNARRYGVKVGSYHFLRTGTSIRSQFENFINSVKIEEQDLVPLLDVEYRRGWTDQQLRDSVKLFADLLEEHYGCRPMIYTSSSFFNSYLAPTFANYPLFIARYSKSRPQLTRGAKWILWQFSERGRIQGIDAYVDLCRFNEGCDINDILISRNRSRRGNSRVAPPMRVPEPKNRRTGVQARQQVPLSKKQQKELQERQRQEQEAKERALKEAQKKSREQAKQQEKLRKQQEKEAKRQAKLREQAERQKQRELQKQLAEQRKQQQRKQQEQTKKLQELQKKQQQLNQSNKKKNQSSADNDDDIYMPTRQR